MENQIEPLEKFGPYELHELINTGGMSEVWLATDSSQKHFALRRMLPVSPFAFTQKRRFDRGCEILKLVSDHPLIISYIEHGKIRGRRYMLMEYLEGQNLKLLAAEGDPVLTENIAAILIDAAEALQHVHDCHYMHLDFKPENVMLSRNASVRLLDFDLSKRRPEKPEKSKDNPGTPAYMSPEQLQREPFDHRVDIFAFGVSAFELLTGQKPFPGDSPDHILRRHLDRSDFVDPRAYNPDIPLAMEKVILKCIETQMDDRYPHMSVLMRDLESALCV